MCNTHIVGTIPCQLLLEPMLDIQLHNQNEPPLFVRAPRYRTTYKKYASTTCRFSVIKVAFAQSISEKPVSSKHEDSFLEIKDLNSKPRPTVPYIYTYISTRLHANQCTVWKGQVLTQPIDSYQCTPITWDRQSGSSSVLSSLCTS